MVVRNEPVTGAAAAALPGVKAVASYALPAYTLTPPRTDIPLTNQLIAVLFVNDVPCSSKYRARTLVQCEIGVQFSPALARGDVLVYFVDQSGYLQRKKEMYVRSMLHMGDRDHGAHAQSPHWQYSQRHFAQPAPAFTSTPQAPMPMHSPAQPPLQQLTTSAPLHKHHHAHFDEIPAKIV